MSIHDGRSPVPGAREPGRLTRFGPTVAILPDCAGSMDGDTIAERQREGGGAPRERRPPKGLPAVTPTRMPPSVP